MSSKNDMKLLWKGWDSFMDWENSCEQGLTETLQGIWRAILYAAGVHGEVGGCPDYCTSIEIPCQYLCDIRVERSWRDWLVYLDVTDFIDKKYEKYYGRPGNERIFRLGVQWDFWVAVFKQG